MPRKTRPSARARAASERGRKVPVCTEVSILGLVTTCISGMMLYLSFDECVAGAAGERHSQEGGVGALGFQDLGGDEPGLVRVEDDDVGGCPGRECTARF